jgi:hypothetical protein
MKTVRFTAGILYYLSRIAAVIILLIAVYALGVILLHLNNPSSSLPISVPGDGSFQIFFPFTEAPFLLGDYTAPYLVSNLLTVGFYGLFLWLLSCVFHAFKQQKIFTRRSVNRLSRFYIVNLVVPFIFIGLLAVFGQTVIDVVRIILLHLVIGVFAWFMAAIFKQGLVLQEEQDLTF